MDCKVLRAQNRHKWTPLEVEKHEKDTQTLHHNFDSYVFSALFLASKHSWPSLKQCEGYPRCYKPICRKPSEKSEALSRNDGMVDFVGVREGWRHGWEDLWPCHHGWGLNFILPFQCKSYDVIWIYHGCNYHGRIMDLWWFIMVYVGVSVGLAGLGDILSSAALKRSNDWTPKATLGALIDVGNGYSGLIDGFPMLFPRFSH